MTKPTPLELLAPAGNADIGMASIDHGADAVYIGAPRFSARAEAGNTIKDIARLVAYAHLYHARIYVALNTIRTDAEIPEARNLIEDIFRAGADALIIQDPGLLELDLPPIPLIASTQMHNNTVEKVRFLEAVGFQRVILARELSLAEIAAIRAETRIELETFVHGALCVSYSGQCYMSQAVAGRSGNRGVCAQPCRSRYTLTDGKGKVLLKQKFPLSLKDLNLMAVLPTLAAAGVTSFKIEGRYKDIAYVKNITAAYRQALDTLIGTSDTYCRASSGDVTFNFSPDPSRTFNRGYTRYFIDGRKEKIASLDTQKSLGQYIGVITSTSKNYFIMAQHDLQNGDGLCFFTKDRLLTGFRINRVEDNRIYPNSMKGLTKGVELLRNHDQAFSRCLQKPASARRHLNVAMTFRQDSENIHLEVRDEDGHQIIVSQSAPFEPARDPSKAERQIRSQLSSTGNTPYQVTDIRIDADPLGFLPLSVLNSLRRMALEALTQERLAHYPRRPRQLVPNEAPYPEARMDYRANVLNEHARRFYARHGAKFIEPAFETLADPAGKTVMTTRYCLRHQLDACPKVSRPLKPLKEPLRINDGRHTYRLRFDCRACCMEVILEGQKTTNRKP